MSDTTGLNPPVNPILSGTPLGQAGPQGTGYGKDESPLAGFVPGGTPGIEQTGGTATTSDATTAGQDALAEVEKKYPEWSWLLYTPLAPVIIQLAGENADQATITNTLNGNPTWNQLSQAVQGNLAELATNPGEFYRQLQTQEQTVQQQFNQMGLQPTQDQINALSFQGLFNGWDATETANHVRKSIQINADGSFSLASYYIDPATNKAVDVFSGREAFYGPNNQPATPDLATAQAHWGQNYASFTMSDGTQVYYSTDQGAIPVGTGTAAGGSPLGGTLEQYQQQITQLAKQYMLQLSPQDISRIAANIVSGQNTIQGATAYMQSQALSQWGNMPDVVAAIQRGQTPLDYFGPIQNAIASTLQTDPNSINFNDQKWQKLLTTTDAKTGMTASVPTWQVLQNVRSDPSYGWQGTPDARAAAYGMVQGLMQTFGKANFGGQSFPGLSPVGG